MWGSFSVFAGYPPGVGRCDYALHGGYINKKFGGLMGKQGVRERERGRCFFPSVPSRTENTPLPLTRSQHTAPDVLARRHERKTEQGVAGRGEGKGPQKDRGGEGRGRKSPRHRQTTHTQTQNTCTQTHTQSQKNKYTHKHTGSRGRAREPVLRLIRPEGRKHV